VDFGRQQLPWFATFEATPIGLHWTLRTAQDQPDGMVVQWQGAWTIEGRATNVLWRIAQPVSPGGVTLPRLPATHAELDPQAQTVAVTATAGTVSMVDYDIITSYDEFRSQPDTLITPFLGLMGVYVDMPYQRRFYTATVGQ
jgi:hypothetical protein